MGQVRTLIGRGIYDADEIARLTEIPVRTISRWASTPSHGGGLLFAADRRLFTFWDLITARATQALLDRGASLPKIRDARDYLATRVETPWPLAHFAVLNQLANIGSTVLLDDGGEWLDAALGGQGALSVVVEPLLHRLEFDHDSDDMASSWTPRDGIVLRPTVQAGSPCVAGTRISTAMLADLHDQGDTIEDLADDYEIDPELVQRAIDYEADLEQAA